MNLRKPDPFTCTRCGFNGRCSPCFFREVDYKTRTGLCKKCAAKGEEKMAVKSVMAKQDNPNSQRK